ncbi:MAG: hypothetical protein ABFE07_09290 [Armatimonadia bacterium]
MADTPNTPRDVDDISLDDARPAKKRGRAAGILLLLVLIGIVLLVWWFSAEAKRAAEERQKAETARQAQLTMVQGNIADAVAAGEAGNVDLALNKLQIAEDKLGQMISAANSENNQQAAQEAYTKRQFVIDARKAIEEEQTRFRSVVNEKLGSLRAAFGVAQSIPSATPATEGTTGTTPAPDAGVVAPNPEAPISPEAPQVAPVPGAAAPAAPGATPAAPAAPAAPAPAAPAVPAAS